MYSLLDEQYFDNKDALVYIAFADKCCNENFIKLHRILFMIYELQSTFNSDDKSLKEALFNEKIEKILKEQCKDLSEKVPNDVDAPSSYLYLSQFYSKNYNKIALTNDNVCFCDVSKITISELLYAYTLSTNPSYNEILVGLRTETETLIQKYIN